MKVIRHTIPLFRRIRGDTKECTMHYGDTFPKDRKKRAKERQQIVKFVGFTDDQARRILAGEGQPNGENLVRLRFFLFHQGYCIEELNNLEVEAFDLGWLLTSRGVSIDEICEFVGVTKGNVFRNLQGKASGFREKEAKEIKDFVSKLALERQHQISSFLKPFNFPILVSESKKTEQGTRITKEKPPLSKGEIQYVSNLITYLVGELTTFTEDAISDSFSPDDRAKLREVCSGGNGIFDLSNRLDALSSETGRKAYMEGKS